MSDFDNLFHMLCLVLFRDPVVSKNSLHQCPGLETVSGECPSWYRQMPLKYLGAGKKLQSSVGARNIVWASTWRVPGRRSRLSIEWNIVRRVRSAQLADHIYIIYVLVLNCTIVWCRGVQLHNPFHTIWKKDRGETVAVSFHSLFSVCFFIACYHI